MFISDMDRKLNQVRDVLGTLDATRAINCDPVDAATRADAILSVPQLKGLAVFAADGSQTCSTLPMSVAPVAEFADSATDFSSFERLDVVSLGKNGRLALRLQRKPANSTSTLAAVVPLSDLASWSNQTLGRAIDHGRLRLLIGKHTLLDLSDSRSFDESATLALATKWDDPAVEATAIGGRPILTAGSPTYPLSITASVPRQPSIFTDTRRLVVDFALSAAFLALLVIFFLRDPAQDFGPARFDQAIRRNEFDVAYRPIIDLHSGTLAGAIIEMRWRRSGGIVLPSSDFMPAVVRSGFEPQMLRYALRKCQEDLSEAYKLRLRLQLKVAIDRDTLIQPGFIDLLRRSLAGASLRPSQLVLALRPIGATANAERFRAVLKDVQRLGVQLQVRQSTGEIAFGQGTDDAIASAIGIDFRLTQALDAQAEGNTEQARLWIRDIVMTCASTGVRVCAYRIGTYEVLKQLKELGVDEVEGDILAPALTPGSFLALVARAGLDRNDPAVREDRNQIRRTGGL